MRKNYDIGGNAEADARAQDPCMFRNTGWPLLRAVILEDDAKPVYQRLLISMGYDTTLAHKVSDARNAIRDLSPELILIDIERRDGNGVDLMDELGSSVCGRFVVISGDDSQRAAVKSIRNRAVDFLVKPVSLGQLRECLNSPGQNAGWLVSGDQETNSSNFDSPAQVAPPTGFWIDHGSSSVLRHLRITASLCAERRRGHALVTGDSGLDKRSVAQAVHYRSRRVGRCVLVNCQSEQDDDALTRFFGAVDPLNGGQVSTGYLEQACGGTLVLENVECLSRAMQSALMSFLDSGQYRPVNAQSSASVVVAVIGTSEINRVSYCSEHAVPMSAGFMNRLAQVHLKVPSLSECVGDIEAIANFLLAQCVPADSDIVRFSKDAIEMIVRTQWANNVRQLRGVILDSLQHHAGGPELQLSFDAAQNLTGGGYALLNEFVGGSIREFERDIVLGTLEYHDGDRKATAKTLGVSLKTLYNRLHAYNLNVGKTSVR